MQEYMKKIIYSVILCCLGACILTAEAQNTVFNGQIPVKIQRLRQTGDSVEVSIDFDFAALSLGTERSLILTPVLTNDKGRELKLKDIQINGKQQHKAFLREVKLNGWERQVAAAHYAVISIGSAKRELFHYEWPVELEPWMSDARMYVISDLCACGGEAQQIATERIAERIVMEDVKPYRVLPNVAYIRPAAEEIKARSESNDVFLDFPVSRTEINPGYGNNPRELAKIESITNEIRSDANVRVTGVSIAGYASPEGEIGFNNELSRGRAEALRNYLASRSGIPPQLYRLGSGGEDWEGLSRTIQSLNNFGPKETVLSIIRYYPPAERKDRLKALDDGRLWQWMLNEIYPRLRRVVSRIEYTVRGFDVEEAKEVIKTRPQQLSLNEMFLVANTYEEGSKEFESVFETAVRVFPNDQVANLNAAAAALLKGDLPKAENYLRKSKRNTPAYYNNLGVLNMMQNNLPRARTLFQRAAEANLDVALKNLEELKKKEEADRLLKN
jgi:outer membrane protein OmpA-like peptidoglycan-associated protein